MARILKLLITVVATLIIPTTGVIYLGATNIIGRLSITLTGLLVYFSLAFWYSWLHHRPTSFRDWLRN